MAESFAARAAFQAGAIARLFSRSDSVSVGDVGCSFAASGSAPLHQHLRRCLSCRIARVCTACATTCHAGHALGANAGEADGSTRGTCDCPQSALCDICPRVSLQIPDIRSLLQVPIAALPVAVVLQANGRQLLDTGSYLTPQKQDRFAWGLLQLLLFMPMQWQRAEHVLELPTHSLASRVQCTGSTLARMSDSDGFVPVNFLLPFVKDSVLPLLARAYSNRQAGTGSTGIDGHAVIIAPSIPPPLRRLLRAMWWCPSLRLAKPGTSRVRVAPRHHCAHAVLGMAADARGGRPFASLGLAHVLKTIPPITLQACEMPLGRRPHDQVVDPALLSVLLSVAIPANSPAQMVDLAQASELYLQHLVCDSRSLANAVTPAAASHRALADAVKVPIVKRSRSDEVVLAPSVIPIPDHDPSPVVVVEPAVLRSPEDLLRWVYAEWRRIHRASSIGALSLTVELRDAELHERYHKVFNAVAVSHQRLQGGNAGKGSGGSSSSSSSSSSSTGDVCADGLAPASVVRKRCVRIGLSTPSGAAVVDVAAIVTNYERGGARAYLPSVLRAQGYRFCEDSDSRLPSSVDMEPSSAAAAEAAAERARDDPPRPPRAHLCAATVAITDGDLNMAEALSPLALLLHDPALLKVVHDAGDVLPWLQADFGLQPVNVWDTLVALDELAMLALSSGSATYAAADVAEGAALTAGRYEAPLHMSPAGREAGFDLRSAVASAVCVARAPLSCVGSAPSAAQQLEMRRGRGTQCLLLEWSSSSLQSPLPPSAAASAAADSAATAADNVSPGLLCAAPDGPPLVGRLVQMLSSCLDAESCMQCLRPEYLGTNSGFALLQLAAAQLRLLSAGACGSTPSAAYAASWDIAASRNGDAASADGALTAPAGGDQWYVGVELLLSSLYEQFALTTRPAAVIAASAATAPATADPPTAGQWARALCYASLRSHLSCLRVAPHDPHRGGTLHLPLCAPPPWYAACKLCGAAGTHFDTECPSASLRAPVAAAAAGDGSS